MAQEHVTSLASAGWFDQAMFGYFPYIALSVLAIGSVIRFDREPYTWRSGSSQLLRRKQLVLGSVLFHLGVLVETGSTEFMFTNPHDQRTQDYITGRFG